MAKNKNTQINFGNRYSLKTVYGNLILSVILVGLGLYSYTILNDSTRVIVMLIAAVGAVAGLYLSWWTFKAYRVFSYNSKKSLSRRIVEKTASYLHVPEGGVCLDVGCASGALSILVAKSNQEARVIGIDRWEKNAHHFSEALCKSNAQKAGADNVTFIKADPVALPFDDERFDAVTSLYAYHQIPGVDKQKMLLETLRTLRKGGSFAIVDQMNKRDFGDLKAFVKKLEDMGYADVHLIRVTDGTFMTRRQASRYGLKNTLLLYGQK